MVDRNEVWNAAAAIRARPAGPDGRKERVSVRTVRKELGRGSFGDIARPLARWKEDEAYQPIIERADLPEAFAARLAVLGRELLEQARIEVTRAKLPEFAAAAEGLDRQRSTLDEALDRVDELEGQVAALRSEVERLRGPAGSMREAASDPVPVPAAPLGPDGTAGEFVAVLMGRKLARDADAFWADVRAAVEAAMGRQGPMPVHALYQALPVSLRLRGAEVGLPLTPAWLRYHLLRMSEPGGGLTETDGRFGLAPVAPQDDALPWPTSADEVAEMGRRRFWRRFVKEVHDILVAAGPLGAEEILERMDPCWVEATERFQTINPGRLRYKLRERIREDRPFEEMTDGRFIALAADVPWDGESRMPKVAGTGSAVGRWHARSTIVQAVMT